MRPTDEMYLASNDGARFFGPESFELFAGVDRLGSLAASAQAMGMSYSKAVRMLHAAEMGFGYAMTRRRRGGDGGGGSVLTPHAADLLDRYRAWVCASESVQNQFFGACFAGFDDVPRLGCVVMASGEARRFGAQKLLAPLGGIPILERTLRSLPLDLVDVVVVTRSCEVASLCDALGVTAVTHDGALQSDTVRRGLDVMGERCACMFVQGDQPLVSGRSMRALVREACLNPGAIVRLAWGDKPASPIVFPARLFDALRSIAGDKGGSSILKARPELQRDMRLVQAAGEWELLDVDTKDDLVHLEGVLAGKVQMEEGA